MLEEGCDDVLAVISHCVVQGCDAEPVVEVDKFPVVDDGLEVGWLVVLSCGARSRVAEACRSEESDVSSSCGPIIDARIIRKAEVGKPPKRIWA